MYVEIGFSANNKPIDIILFKSAIYSRYHFVQVLSTVDSILYKCCLQ